ncbi:zinc-binding dehydrogenase [Argonema antarcticum]|uniref:zinc-binding dehydrogenase n=1 Tax=Argonema antarcticum TaxID=2942763 RepID=UPI002013981C|nr:zinc-binding dehydrogenase [Argonema antarcticum]MCL1471386.1 zinc-binding dehydrogenase [Argonema antarcticum A004/B2]
MKTFNDTIESDRSNPTATSSESQNVYLTISSPGLLDTLTFRPLPRQKPGVGEVEIEVSVTGLNFKEVLLALGLVPVPTNFNFKFGIECVGKIKALGEGVDGLAIGDEVIAFGTSCFSRFITTSAQLVAPKPAHLSLEEAATIPVAFVTAYYALIKLGKLRQGERILIHSAAGGVGMAAVQIAQWIGAEIFATAGNDEKREFLRSLGIQQVMDSRSLTFADEVMKRTEGKGVDVVLNSLGGEFIPKSLAVLGRYGRFLEIGQRDILNNSQLGLQPFEKRLSFFAIQVEPELPNFSELWREVVQHFNNKVFTPLPHQVFPISEIVRAFEYMTAGKHIGKIAISWQDKIEVEEEKYNVLASTTPQFSAKKLPIKFLENGLLPSEGINVFRRILESKLPQVLVSTRDLTTLIERHNSDSILSFSETGEKTDLSQATHPRPELSNAYIAPLNEIEETIANIWQKFLGVKQVGIHDNFFELGGHSLLATQVIAQMRLAIEMDLPLSILFDAPTVAEISQYIEKIRLTTQKFQAPINTELDDRMEIEL